MRLDYIPNQLTEHSLPLALIFQCTYHLILTGIHSVEASRSALSGNRTFVQLQDSISRPIEALSTDPSLVNSTECNFEVSHFALFIQLALPVLFGLFLIVGLVGNLLVIIVVALNRQMRNTTNILILSLAIADLAFIFICVPSTALIYLLGRWSHGDILCKLFLYCTHVSLFCSVYTLVLMSLDRFLAVVYPVSSNHLRTQRNTLIAVVLVWICTLTANMPIAVNSMVVFGPVDGRESPCTTEYCTYKELVTFNSTNNLAQDNRQGGQMFFLRFFIFSFLVPFLVISGLYMALIFRLRFTRTANMAQSAEAKRSKRRVTRMIVTVVIVFGLSWLPLHIVFLVQYFRDPNTDAFRIIQILANCLAYGNSSINPILYAFLSPKFRIAFVELLHGRRVRNQFRATSING